MDKPATDAHDGHEDGRKECHRSPQDTCHHRHGAFCVISDAWIGKYEGDDHRNGDECQYGVRPCQTEDKEDRVVSSEFLKDRRCHPLTHEREVAGVAHIEDDACDVG